MSESEYKLSSTLFGHSLDVRSVKINHENNIISGSRDKTSKLWIPNMENNGYIDSMTYKGHSNFVSSLCCLPPSPEAPTGVLITGGNDNKICVYFYDLSEPIITYEGHKNTVCDITKGNIQNTFLTSSWDCTAKLWKISDNTLKELVIFSGHDMSVWAVLQLPNGNVVTGSADRDVVIWTEKGQKVKILKGHTDCVRSLALLNENNFVSVSNDASIKLWTLNGECLNTFYGHESFIYSVCANPKLGFDSFVTGGEDRTIRCWKNGENVQTITIPAQSIWSVTVLPNGDIVSGSSDGVVRVFTRDSSRIADEQQLKTFNEEVAKLTATANQEIGGVKISDLPGREVLYEPGKSDGQTKLIREGASVTCYSWSASDGTWNKVGDVMGSAGGTQATSGKSLYEGQEYDFVFSVDIEDGKPAIKLPYNRGEDPWTAAQAFIHRNGLPQVYLEQVANFIVVNGGGAGVAPAAGAATGYVDPFTGGNRYLPGSGSTASSNQSGSNLDPFTGSSSYTTTSQSNLARNSTANQNAHTSSVSYFPHLSYLFFDQANISAIHEKLKEFNKKTGDNMLNFDEDTLEGVVKLASGSQTEAVYVTALVKLLQWSHDIVFPALDITRLAVRHYKPNSQLCSLENGEFLLNILRLFTTQGNAANKMLSFRILANLFSFPDGENLILKNQNLFIEDLKNSGDAMNKNCQIALSTFLLNLSISLVKKQNSLSLQSLIDTLTRIILKLSDQEAEFRCYVALGTILVTFNFNNCLGIQSSDLLSQLQAKLATIAVKNSTDSLQMRNINCAQQLISLLN